MKLNSKFNILAILSSALLIVNFLFSEKNFTTVLLLFVSIAAIIVYTVYQENHAVAELEAKVANLDKMANKVGLSYDNVKKGMSDIKSTSARELDKVDEIASALENTSMMVIRNKENTRQAAQLTQDVIKAVEQGNAEMQEMMSSINDIKSLSDEIQKIVKVIDDIAFQTNILALNAAVEAARAGDAGKGFAVVADEVRNLAQKSSDAVNNTSKIIDKNIISAENGVNISVRVEKALNKMSEEIGKVEELINEITASSEEQASEVVRTKDLATELDSIVNAANDAKDKADKVVTGLSDDITKVHEAVEKITNGAKLDDSYLDNKSSLSKFSDKEFKSLSIDPLPSKENKTFSLPETKVEVKKDILDKKKDDDDDDDFFSKPVSSQAEETAAAGDDSDVEDNGFDAAAFKRAQAESMMSTRKISKQNAEAILPLDDSDGF